MAYYGQDIFEICSFLRRSNSIVVILPLLGLYMNIAESGVDKVIVDQSYKILCLPHVTNTDQKVSNFYSTSTSTLKTRGESW